MTITIQFYEYTENRETDYNKMHQLKLTGKNAAECMDKIECFRENHNLWQYTPVQIVNVED